jgi:UDP-galactopyranose mutase
VGLSERFGICGESTAAQIVPARSLVVDLRDSHLNARLDSRAASSHYDGALTSSLLFMVDFLIVGAGFAGSVLAERIASQLGGKVLLIDRRAHIAGNAYDCHDSAGVLIHRYGPHIFHTNSARIVEYLSQFTEWHPYEHRVLASVDGKLVPLPINLNTVNRLYGLRLTSPELESYFQRIAEPRDPIATSEDVVVSKVGRDLYEKLFRGYTRKQWGLDPSELDSQVTARVPARFDTDDRYFTDSFQCLPRDGFTRMFEKMLNHPNIDVQLGTDLTEVLGRIQFRRMIYTGAIDEFFQHRLGKLPYRSLEFRHETRDCPVFQPVGVVNYPNEYEYTRITEFKHLTGQVHPKTSIVFEYPRSEGDPYYPIPRAENHELFRRYQRLAVDEAPHVHFVGRLASYRYYNMDQVIGAALSTFDKIQKPLRR